ncbi:MAG: thioredoxin family protein [Fuerstiella sp.]|nr:thioredoxin family protein [Fuerstiella sp.]MCP4511843.1 thioredoxin family protein [Fuerstiella sp.]
MALQFIRVAGCFCALLIVSAPATAGGWEHDFETALSRSRERERPLLLHFYADWCGPCRSMERNVLNTAEVLSALTTKVVGLKVNSDARRDLVRRYGIATLPSDVIVAPDGNVIHRASGAASRSAFLAKLTRFGRPYSALSPTTVAQSAVQRSSGEKQPLRQPALTRTAAVHEQSTDVVTESTVARAESAPVMSESIVAAAKKTVVAPESTVLETESTLDVPQSAVTVSEQAIDADFRQAFNEQFTQINDVEDPEPSLTPTLHQESGRRIGLIGYCPVSLSTESKWVQGVDEFHCEYQRVHYYLSSAPQMKKFQANPERYIPYLHGCDPVALENDNRIRSGAIELGASYRKRVYFFATEDNRSAFLKAPTRFSAVRILANAD